MRGRSDEPRRHITFVAQLPPPVHGQAVADAELSRTVGDGLELHVVPMRFASDVDDIGRFRLGKVVAALGLLIAVLRIRLRHGGDVLVWSLGARSRLPVLRDGILLALLRPAFDRTVLHLHTGDYGERIEAEPAPIRRLLHRAFGRAEIILLDPELDHARARLPDPVAVHYLNYGVEDVGVGDPAGSGPVLFLGNLYESKGTHELVRAVAELRDRSLDVRVVMAGAAPSADELADLERLIADLGIADRVELIGPVHGADKGRVLREASMLCFPTHYEAEGMPLVVMEAMGAGRPVVATRWRAIPSMVDEGTTGFLVEPGDVTALADRIQQVVTDQALAARMSVAARAVYERRFTLDRFRVEFAGIVRGPGVAAVTSR